MIGALDYNTIIELAESKKVKIVGDQTSMSCFTQIWVSHASRLHEQLQFNRWEATKNFVRTRSGSIPKAEQDKIRIVSTRYKDTTILGNPDADDKSLNI